MSNTAAKQQARDTGHRHRLPFTLDSASLEWKLPTKQTDELKNYRSTLFEQFDVGGAGHLTETDAVNGVRDVLKLNEAVRGGDASDIYSSVVPLAFDRAANVAPGGSPFHGGSALQRTLQRIEFRLFLLYLRHYLELFTIFDEADMAATGTLDFHEFRNTKLGVKHGAKVGSNAEQAFQTMDQYSRGEVDFSDFVTFFDLETSHSQGWRRSGSMGGSGSYSQSIQRNRNVDTSLLEKHLKHRSLRGMNTNSQLSAENDLLSTQRNYTTTTTTEHHYDHSDTQTNIQAEIYYLQQQLADRDEKIRVLESQPPQTVERVVEKRVEVPVHVPVEKIVERKVNVQVPVKTVVERRVEVPVTKIVEKRVEVPVPVERIVEKRVEVPVPVPTRSVSIPEPMMMPNNAMYSIQQQQQFEQPAADLIHIVDMESGGGVARDPWAPDSPQWGIRPIQLYDYDVNSNNNNNIDYQNSSYGGNSGGGGGQLVVHRSLPRSASATNQQQNPTFTSPYKMRFAEQSRHGQHSSPMLVGSSVHPASFSPGQTRV